jgi:L-ribulose-5-phosphate 3-epimerase
MTESKSIAQLCQAPGPQPNAPATEDPIGPPSGENGFGRFGGKRPSLRRVRLEVGKAACAMLPLSNTYIYRGVVGSGANGTLFNGFLLPPTFNHARLRGQAILFLFNPGAFFTVDRHGVSVSAAMNNHESACRLGVCSWSLQPTGISDLLNKLQATGIKGIQLALDPLRDKPADWEKLPQLFQQNGIKILSGMFGCVGEDYSSLETIRLTGGIAPDSTWEKNRANIQATSTLAQSLGLQLVTFHAGFIPHSETDRDYAKMIDRLGYVAEVFERAKIAVGLETGQETAPVLAKILSALNRPNIGVNFDPANMILYGKGDPIEALQLLGPRIRQVHIKDAIRTKVPGTWGQEVAAGHGEVNWMKFFKTLADLKFTGPIVIEREAGNQRVADIRQARKVAEQAGL